MIVVAIGSPLDLRSTVWLRALDALTPTPLYVVTADASLGACVHAWTWAMQHRVPCVSVPIDWRSPRVWIRSAARVVSDLDRSGGPVSCVLGPGAPPEFDLAAESLGWAVERLDASGLPDRLSLRAVDRARRRGTRSA